MSVTLFSRLSFYSVVVVLVLLQGCNWVDSTGRQDNSTPISELSDGDVFSKLEEDSFDIDASAEDADGTIDSYSWEDPTSEGNLEICIGEFDSSLAGDSLAEVCEDADNCEILFVEDDESEGLFHVLLPKITAPIGVSQQLVVKDNDGGKTYLTANFCIDSVNEAPIGGTDVYSVSEGETLIVDAAAGNGLLANDTDDNDVRNEALIVVGLAAGQGPSYAKEFTLGTDGSFSYTVSGTTASTIKQDTFTYELYDGDSIGVGTVNIDLSVVDDPPNIIGFVPGQTAVLGLSFGPLNISGKFNDPENSALEYSAVGLPTGVSINATSGIISGTVAASNTVKVYSVTVSAFDGLNSVSLAPFSFTVTANSAPKVVSLVANQTATAGVAFSVSVASHFTDPEAQTLSYTQSGLPSSFTMSAAGLISGTATAADVGIYTVTATASDSVSSVSTSFVLTVEAASQPPIYTAPVSIPPATVGLPYTYNVYQHFTDPEGEVMTYTATGLPGSNNLTISAAGVISGIPTAADLSAGLTVQVTATDSSGNQTVGTLPLLTISVGL